MITRSQRKILEKTVKKMIKNLQKPIECDIDKLALKKEFYIKKQTTFLDKNFNKKFHPKSRQWKKYKKEKRRLSSTIFEYIVKIFKKIVKYGHTCLEIDPYCDKIEFYELDNKKKKCTVANVLKH